MNMAPASGPNIRLLKAIVIGLGMAILAAMVAIVFAVGNLVGGGAPSPGAGNAAEAFHATLAIPPDGRIVRILAAGDTVALHLEFGDGGQRILFVDPRTGETRGRLDLVPER